MMAPSRTQRSSITLLYIDICNLIIFLSEPHLSILTTSFIIRSVEDMDEDEERFESDDLKIFSSKETERDGKFLLYWRTTTLTSTSTSYTVTHSLKKLECTPSGFQMNGNICINNFYMIIPRWILTFCPRTATRRHRFNV